MTYLFNLLRMKEIIKKNIKGIHFNMLKELENIIIVIIISHNYNNIEHFNLKIHVCVGIIKQSKLCFW